MGAGETCCIISLETNRAECVTHKYPHYMRSQWCAGHFSRHGHDRTSSITLSEISSPACHCEPDLTLGVDGLFPVMTRCVHRPDAIRAR